MISLVAIYSINFVDRSFGYAMRVVIPLNCWAAAHYFLASRTLTEHLQAID